MFKRIIKKTDRGFTLLECLFAIVLIGIDCVVYNIRVIGVFGMKTTCTIPAYKVVPYLDWVS